MKPLAPTCVIVGLALSGPGYALGLHDRLDRVHGALLEDRRAALPGLSDPFQTPQLAREVLEVPRAAGRGGYPWKRNVVATIFWVGEQPSENNPTPNHMSAWDQNWQENFGGYDDPVHRDAFAPAAFSPRLNPFYVALPYNDVAQGGVHREEAERVIPWFWERYQGDGISVCKGRWIAIHHQGEVCYAQWEDVGPFETNHWQYVFGPEAPRKNRNANAGIDVSPAVRDFLKLKSGARVEWRFVEDYQVPSGPWHRATANFFMN